MSESDNYYLDKFIETFELLNQTLEKILKELHEINVTIMVAKT